MVTVPKDIVRLSRVLSDIESACDGESVTAYVSEQDLEFLRLVRTSKAHIEKMSLNEKLKLLKLCDYLDIPSILELLCKSICIHLHKMDGTQLKQTMDSMFW